VTGVGASELEAEGPSALDPLLDRAPCGFVSFADDGCIRAVNATLLSTLGYTRAELAGRRIEALLTIGSRIFYQTHFFPLLRLQGQADEVFLLLSAKDGQDVGALANAVRRERDGAWVTDCVLMPVRERRKFEDALVRAKKEAETALALADAHRRDVEAANAELEQQAAELEANQQQIEEQAEELRTINDELLERTLELEQQRTLAEEANKAKSAFLASMSHELRTPLNAIGGYVQLLDMGLQGPVTDAQREALGRIERSQRHLLRLINDILNLARIEAGRVEYREELVPLHQVAAAVLPMIEPQLAERGLRIEMDVPRDVIAWADGEKVEQVLLNLLSNAVKFTASGGSIRVDATHASPPDGLVRLRVRDTGIGIPADRLDHVFEPFVQVKVGHINRTEGTGLGLAISRDLARGMGGDLSLESTLGVGSTFTLALPVATTPAG